LYKDVEIIDCGNGTSEKLPLQDSSLLTLKKTVKQFVHWKGTSIAYGCALENVDVESPMQDSKFACAHIDGTAEAKISDCSYENVDVSQLFDAMQPEAPERTVKQTYLKTRK
jgi:hypothetical protein